MMEAGSSQEEYIRQVLDAYLNTPGTTGTVRRPDRMLAAIPASIRRAIFAR